MSPHPGHHLIKFFKFLSKRSLKRGHIFNHIFDKSGKSMYSLGCYFLSFYHIVGYKFHFFDIKVCFVFKTLALFQIDGHIVKLSWSLVRKIWSIQYRYWNLLFKRNVSHKRHLISETNLHLITSCPRLLYVLIPQNRLFRSYWYCACRSMLAGLQSWLSLVTWSESCPRWQMFFCALRSETDRKWTSHLFKENGI